ncbi:MAG: CotH kinase family protein [Prevotella sp.]
MKKIYFAALFCAAITQAKAQLVINEIMQSNIDCIMDDINEFPDSWVELYNGGSSTINLSQYSIGDTENSAEAWKLPNSTIAPGAYALIYCDKEEQGFHTPFRLESGKGCAVYLFENNQLVDKIEGLKKQPAPNIAYGRKNDGSDTWGYMATPTPKAANCGETLKDLLGEPVFSRNGCVMENGSSFSLQLSLPDASTTAEIRYTLDGSEPTRTNYLYSTPIQISKTTIVRAKLFAEGMLSPRSTTQSYIFFPREVTLPVISIVTDSKYFYDDKMGIYVDGTYSSQQKNYEYDWRRPINLEIFFDKDKKSQLNQLCETRIMGGATRSSALKSLAIYANKRFGEKRFDYEFFPDQRPGVTDFKSLALRNAGNDFDYLYMRDAIIQRTAASYIDIDWQAWRPAIVYINGEYKGMLNIRERSNEDNIYTNYDGLEDIDMFENWWELKSGTWDHYNAFKTFYNEHGHTMTEYEKWMDTQEFLNLMLVNLFFNNRDFPGNNIVMWRPRTEDGRWRWIMKDTDFGLGLYGTQPDYNTIAWVNNHDYDPNTSWANDWEHTRLFRRLMEDDDFKREFIDRAAIYMGDFLNERGTRAIWDPMYEMIKYEYPNHRYIYNPWWPNYDEELANARKFIANRSDYFYKYVAEYYGVGTPTQLTVNTALTDDERNIIDVSMNGVKLSEALFNGKFYANRVLTLSSESNRVKGWKVAITTNGKTEEKEIMGNSYDFIMPSCSSMTVNAIVGDDTFIDNIYYDYEKSADIISLSGAVVRKNATSTEGLPLGIYLWKGRKIVCQ